MVLILGNAVDERHHVFGVAVDQFGAVGNIFLFVIVAVYAILREHIKVSALVEFVILARFHYLFGIFVPRLFVCFGIGHEILSQYDSLLHIVSQSTNFNIHIGDARTNIE